MEWEQHKGKIMAEGMEKIAKELGLNSPIELWAYWEKQSKMPLYIQISEGKSSIETTPTGKWYIRKSKYRIVNWWRRITGTEIKEQEYTYKWKV